MFTYRFEATDPQQSCQCENATCSHGEQSCPRLAVGKASTIYGVYAMCNECAANMPQEYVL